MCGFWEAVMATGKKAASAASKMLHSTTASKGEKKIAASDLAQSRKVAVASAFSKASAHSPLFKKK